MNYSTLAINTSVSRTVHLTSEHCLLWSSVSLVINKYLSPEFFVADLGFLMI